MTNNERLDRLFAAFDTEHPEVWALYHRFAWELKRHRARGSSEQIVQRLRWETAVNPAYDHGYKVNDHYRKRYAMKMCAMHPEFNGFFRFRS